MLSNLMSV